MHWKTKSRIQNALSYTPSLISYAGYYWIQRHFGGLRKINPVAKFKAGITIWRLIKEVGYIPTDKVFLEVGTGWVPLVPIAYWLMGAKSIITIDANPYMKVGLIEESLEYVSANKEEIKELFGDLLNRKRLEELLNFYKSPSFTSASFMDLCKIRYLAPGDAAKTKLKDDSIDFHTSYTVFEHIPPMVLRDIIAEGNRIINNAGLFVHRIDYSDHFSHSDKNISIINFLQYSDFEWGKFAGNRYMYMNRLRHDDMLNILETSRHKVLLSRPDVDERPLELLRSGELILDEKFRTKSHEVLSIRGSWIVSKSMVHA